MDTLSAGDIAAKNEHELFELLDSGRLVATQKLAETKNWLNRANEAPVLYGEGDSWFKFPLPLSPLSPSNILGALRDLGYVVEGHDSGALADTVQRMAKPANLAFLRQRLLETEAEAFLFSGSWNDIFVVGHDDHGVEVPESAIGYRSFYQILRPKNDRNEYFDPARLQQLLDHLATDLWKIARIALELRLPCILHTYGVPSRFGDPASGGRLETSPSVGPWISDILRARGYRPIEDGPDILDAFMKHFRQMLLALSGRGVQVVDLTTIITTELWRDELQLTPEGWRRCAEVYRALFADSPRRLAPVAPLNHEALSDRLQTIQQQTVESLRFRESMPAL